MPSAAESSTNNSPPSGQNGAPKKVRLPRKIQAVHDHDTFHAEGRTIIVCLDGTGDKFDNDNSNIVNFVATLKKDDKNQVSYYQSGIGTYGRNGLQGGMSAALDMAVGSELGLHVRDAYHYLMHTYKEGDRICLFGFSRGAYTARCLAGMVHKVGLLPPRNLAQIPFAYEFYKDDSPEGWKQSAEFKKTFCVDVSCYFVGVYDSVASVGVIPRQLPLSSTPSNKSRYFRHVVSLDERRAKFKPCRFQAKDFSDQQDPAAGLVASLNGSHRADDSAANRKAVKSISKHNRLEDELEPGAVSFDTDVLEVWFAGCHADVGGGAVPNDERHKLGNIALRWMIRQCFECNTGIIFKTRALAEAGLDVHTLWPKYKKLTVPTSKPSPAMMELYEKGLPPKAHRAKHLIPVDHTHHGGGHYDIHIADLEEDESNPEWLTEQVEDWFDAMAPINDQLAVAKTWWLLELLPVQYLVQKAESDKWEVKTGANWGRYRGVGEPEPKMHWTVKARMENTDYKIKARYGRNATWHAVA